MKLRPKHLLKCFTLKHFAQFFSFTRVAYRIVLLYAYDVILLSVSVIVSKIILISQKGYMFLLLVLTCLLLRNGRQKMTVHNHNFII